MISLVRGDGRLTLTMLILCLWIGVFSGSTALAEDDGLIGMNPTCSHGHNRSGYGTLGYGGYGLYEGFYGFGLSYHLGYGYGGGALGVGTEGGYPFYGGPGYLHEPPALRRFGHLEPFGYYSGPGYPFSFSHPGQLAVDRPLALSGDAGGLGYPYDVGFGPFTGAIPYPESVFAPFTARAAATGSSAGETRPVSSATTKTDRVRELGIDEEPVLDVDGARCMKVSKVYLGTSAEKAGLKPGDVMRSINGYLTEQVGNLAWIIENGAPDKLLKINVHTAADGKEQTITVRLP